MKKPSYKELEMQIAKLKSQIDIKLNDTEYKAFDLEARTEELRVSNSKLSLEEVKKNKLKEEIDIVNTKLKYLLKLNAEKDRFIAILAHDLRSPLTGILGLLEVMSESFVNNTAEKNLILLDAMQKSTKNTINLVDGLIKWTKSQLGKLAFEPHNYNLKEICTEIIELFQPMAELKKINVKEYVDENLHVFTDINMLKTILRNLLSNAIKYTNENGFININFEESDFFAKITVSDNGIGMSPATANQLFNITHIHSTNGTSNEKGSGLGLLICKELIERNGGEIAVESELSKGSKFIVSLPKKHNNRNSELDKQY
jgi:signal transduction histidine kinase